MELTACLKELKNRGAAEKDGRLYFNGHEIYLKRNGSYESIHTGCLNPRAPVSEIAVATGNEYPFKGEEIYFFLMRENGLVDHIDEAQVLRRTITCPEDISILLGYIDGSSF